MALQSHLREALHEQELKTKQVHDQLQIALFRCDKAFNTMQQLQKKQVSGSLPENNPEDSSLPPPEPSPVFPSENKQEDEQRKNAATDVAAKLAASKSSAQTLRHVLPSLAPEGVVAKEDCPPDTKKPKIETAVPPYVLAPPWPPSPFPHPDSVSPPPPPTLPLMPPMLPSAFVHNYLPPSNPQIPSSLPPFPVIGMPPFPLPPASAFQGFQTSQVVGFFGQPPLPVMPPPLSRQ